MIAETETVYPAAPSKKDEQLARVLRDCVMEQRTKDENWHACRRSWCKSLELFRGRLAEMGLAIREIKDL